MSRMYKVLSIKYEISSKYEVAGIKYGGNATAAMAAVIAPLALLDTSYLILNTATKGRFGTATRGRLGTANGESTC